MFCVLVESSRWRRQFTALVVCALAVRLVAAVVVQGWVSRTPGRLCLIAGDAEGYWGLADSLVRTGEFAIYEPPRRVLRMPGFPLWLAGGMRLFGDRVEWHRVGLALVGTAACAMTALLARQIAGDKAGLIAGWLSALSPPLAGLSVLILSETLFALAIVVNLWFLVAVWDRLTQGQTDSPGNTPGEVAGVSLPAFAAGICSGVATLVRPSWLPFVPFVAGLLLVWPMGQSVPFATRLRTSGLILAGLAAAMAPWVYRNHRVTGHPVVTTLWAGPSLYDGLNPHATGESDMRFIETDQIYQRLSEYEADRYYREAARAFVQADPARAYELALVKLGRYWNPLPNAEQFGHPLLRWLFALWSAPVFAASLAGLARHWRDLRLWIFAAGPILFLGAVHAVFIGSVRYRLPAELPLLTLAALGLLDLQAGRWPGAAPHAGDLVNGPGSAVPPGSGKG